MSAQANPTTKEAQHQDRAPVSVAVTTVAPWPMNRVGQPTYTIA